MITSVRLENFKGFRKYQVQLRNPSILVGPNNAGKSTLISAIRVAAHALQVARSTAAPPGHLHERAPSGAYPLRLDRGFLETRNLRHEYNQVDTQIIVAFKGRSSLKIVWPMDENDRDLEPYFHLSQSGTTYSRPKQVKDIFPSIGVVPVLSPLEVDEQQLTKKYLNSARSGRLVSRHFRNHLGLLTDTDEFDGFRDYLREWLPELDLLGPPDLVRNLGSEATLDLRYKDGRHPKEISWAGDGVQIFAQILLQLYWYRESSTIVLDEPDIMLHPDLQRRLIRVLEVHPAQAILASHSAEILAESDPSGVLWIDKSKARSISVPDEQTVFQLGQSIGSGFNLKLARALRTKFVLFVEGAEAPIIRQFAKTLGLRTFLSESTVTLVDIKGGSNAGHLAGFDWIADKFLASSVHALVVLDRDFHSQTHLDELLASIRKVGMDAATWELHEIENYLLVPSPIARVSGLSPLEVDELLREVSEGVRIETVPAEMIAARMKEPVWKRRDASEVARICQAECTALDWADPETRLRLLPGKEILARLRDRLDVVGGRSFGDLALAREFRVQDIHPNMRKLLSRIDATIMS